MTRWGADCGMSELWNFTPVCWWCFLHLCVLIRICVCKKEKKKQHLWHLCCGAPARSRRASAQTCWLPRGPTGSHTTPTQAPAVKRILLTRSFFPLFSVLLLFFYFASPGSPGTSAAITVFTYPRLFSLHLFYTSLRFPPRSFPGTVPTCWSTPTLAIHGFPKLWRTDGEQARR